MKQPTLFSVWMRDNLKDAFSGLITQDIDFIILNRQKKFFIVEEKNIARARTGPAQAIIYKMIDEILSSDKTFLGCHKATLEWNGIWLDQTGKVSIESFLENPNQFLVNQYGQKWFDSVLYFSLKYLWDGKGVPPTRKTEKEHTFSRESLLAPELAKIGVKKYNIDWIFVNYVSGNFVLLSESDCFNNEMVKHIITKFNEYNLSGRVVENPKSHCHYKFLGAYEISYSTDMNVFNINGHKLSKNDAIRILNLDSNEIEKYR